MKLIDIIRDANSNLFRSKARTILTIIAIFIGALTLTLTNGIGSGISKYIDQQLGNLGASDVLLVQPKAEQSSGTGPRKYDESRATSTAYSEFGPSVTLLQEKDIKTIESVPGIISAEPLLNATPDYISGLNGTKYELSVSGFITDSNIELKDGTLPDNSSSQNQIALPSDYVSAFGFTSSKAAVGKSVTIGIRTAAGQKQEVQATIVAIQANTLVGIDGANINDALLKNLYTIQTEGSPSAKDGYMAVIARVAKNTNDTTMQTIKDRLKAKNYQAATFQDQIGLFKQVIGAIITVLNVFAAIALLAAGFGIVNTLLMSVQERTKEIGLMKAMGLGRGKIFLLFSIEAILLGFWGSLLGSLAGIGVGLTANRVASHTFLKDLPDFNLTAFSFVSVIIIMFIIMVIAFIAGTLPARRASRKDPIDALRYE